VRDARTGELRHATAMVRAHTGDRSDYHATSDADSDTDVCAISAALHQAARSEIAAVAVITAPRLELRSPIGPVAVARLAANVYRLAPKTSPPVRA
jgi:DNA-binding IclR family transcriptional regulator